jgi:glycosyltransferase involved in cell wall biosynthesis
MRQDRYPVATSILVLGPQFGRASAGGMQTHMDVLSSLVCMRDAKFMSLGSANGFRGRITTAMQLLSWRRYGEARRSSRVLINSSMYTSSLLKLAVFMLGLRVFCSGRTFFSVFFHGGRIDPAKLPSLLRWMMAKWPLPLADFYFLTEQQREQFSTLFPLVRQTQLRMFQNYSEAGRASTVALDFEYRHCAGPRPIRLLCVGRVIPEKGQGLVCEAVRALVESGKFRLHLTIVGDGPELSKLKAKYAKEAKTHIIEFVGFQRPDCLQHFYGRSDLLLMPTVWPEGLPYVLIEAYQNGVPVAATSVGALGKHITAVAADLVLTSACIREVSRVIELAAASPVIRKQYSCAAARHFNTVFSRNAAEEFYRDVLSYGSKSPPRAQPSQ